jgi:biotin operon repressor
MDVNSGILAALEKAGAPLKSAEIAAATGIDKAEVDKAIKKLKKEGVVVSPKNCYYSLA